MYGSPIRAGELRASEGLLAQAADEFAAVTFEESADHRAAFRAAVLMLYLGDRSNYDALCQEMLARCDALEDVEAIRRAIHASQLSTPASGDPERMGRLMEQVVAASENPDWAQRECAGCLPPRQLARGSGCSPREPGADQTTQSRMPYTAMNLIIEAMAYHQQNKPAEARGAYYESARIIATSFPYAHTTSAATGWIGSRIN